MPLTFPSTYSRMLVRELALGDTGIQGLLAGTGLHRKDLFSLDHHISLADQHTIIRNGLHISGNPALGLQIGSHMPLSAHGAIGVALAAAPNPLVGFQVMERFGMLRVPVIAVQTAEAGPWFTLRLEAALPMDEVSRFMLEVMVASMLALIELSSPRPGTRPLVELGYPEPPYVERYADYLDAELRFGRAATSLTFARADLEVPNTFADAEVYEQAIALCERLRVRLAGRESWQAKVEGLLQQHPGQIWRIQEVAGALNVSVRSLTRHLAQEGKSYQQLLDQELCRQALVHLSLPGQTVASVANILGYQDVSSFRRAFRRWRGVAPQDWRRNDRADHARLA